MKLSYLVVLLCTLPLLFAVPYMLTVDSAPDAKIAGVEAIVYLAKEKKMMAPDSVEREHQILAFFTDNGFLKGRYSDPEQGAEYLEYYTKMPEKPWPKGIRFPLVIHFLEPSSAAVSAALATRGGLKLDFPAIHIVPILPKGKIWGETNEAAVHFPVGIALEAVGRIMVENPVDARRVYAVGCGDGAQAALSSLKFHPDFFAAAIVHSGKWDLKDTKIFAQTPILMMTGGANKVVPRLSTLNLAKAIKKNGGRVVYREVDSMPHNCGYEGFYTKNVWAWLFANKLSPAEKQQGLEKTVKVEDVIVED